MKQISFLALTLMLFQFSQAQESCEVKQKEIKGTYTGACANGKANGHGKSVGADQYEGEFKDGYPNGKGMYVWQDGHYFIGNYNMGKKEGKGDMYYEAANGSDSVISGYWKKDKYIGEYEKQYIVISNSSGIKKVECSLTDKKGENITITIHQLTNTSNSFASTSIIPMVKEISQVSGTFYTSNNQMLSNSSVTIIQQVTYPFRAIIYLNNGEYTEILFNEKGNYNVYIDMI